MNDIQHSEKKSYERISAELQTNTTNTYNDIEGRERVSGRPAIHCLPACRIKDLEIIGDVADYFVTFYNIFEDVMYSGVVCTHFPFTVQKFKFHIAQCL